MIKIKYWHGFSGRAIVREFVVLTNKLPHCRRTGKFATSVLNKKAIRLIVSINLLQNWAIFTLSNNKQELTHIRKFAARNEKKYNKREMCNENYEYLITLN